MKLLVSFLLMATAGIVASAQPHHAHKHHHHAQKRIAVPDVDIITIPGKVVWIYELNGHILSAEEVQEGIKNGTLVYAVPPPSTDEPTVTPTIAALHLKTQPTTTATPTTSSIIEVESVVIPTLPTTTSKAAPATTTTPAAPATTTPAAQTSVAPVSSSPSSFPAFPDGQLDCSTFPSAYGAVSLDYLGIGGWTGIQTPGSSIGGYDDIMTVTSSTCAGGNCCTEGSFCSYACAPGYQKSQWPATQGKTGQSIGGLQCLNGKLHLTNPSLSQNLCIPGTQAVTVQVKNTLSQNVAVCRTDYPGKCPRRPFQSPAANVNVRY